MVSCGLLVIRRLQWGIFYHVVQKLHSFINIYAMIFLIQRKLELSFH